MSTFYSAVSGRSKTPEQMVESLMQIMRDFLGSSSGEQRAALEPQLVRRLSQIKTLLYGDSKTVDVDEERVKLFARLAIQVQS